MRKDYAKMVKERAELPSEIPENESVKRFRIVGCEKLNLRKEPGLDKPIVLVMHRNEFVTMLNYEAPEGWIAVRYSVGWGYCLKKYLEEVLDG